VVVILVSVAHESYVIRHTMTSHLHFRLLATSPINAISSRDAVGALAEQRQIYSVIAPKNTEEEFGGGNHSNNAKPSRTIPSIFRHTIECNYDLYAGGLWLQLTGPVIFRSRHIRNLSVLSRTSAVATNHSDNSL